ncbi:MAG TPA: hypothetical protein VIL36_05125 [Acidimicrobiales bacterium]
MTLALVVAGAAQPAAPSSARPAVPPAAPPAAGHAQQACGWSDKLSSETRNLLFIDTAATYWSATVEVPDGAHIEVRGDFPRARYLSLVTYDVRGRTIDHLTDTEIDPDPGSVNPFRSGASRTATDRRYTVRVVNERVPAAGPAPNTLYTENADGSRSTRATREARLTLRVYTPDAGTDEAGGVPLPLITVVLPSGERIARPPCLDATTAPVEGAGFSVPGGGGTDPPAWERFLPDGLGENVDNAYVVETFMTAHGEVLALEARAPTFPSTRDGDAEMGTGQVRYWSMCTNLLTTAVLECVQDEDVPVDAAGSFTIVVSRPDARPANATTECGVAWLPAAPDTDTILVYRHMLPDPSFAEAIQNVGPGTGERTMGVYYPRGTYYATADAYERLGCERPAAPEAASAGRDEGSSDGGTTTGTRQLPRWLPAGVALGLALVAAGAVVLVRRATSGGRRGLRGRRG